MRRRFAFALVLVFLAAGIAGAQVILDNPTPDQSWASVSIEKSGSCSGAVTVKERDTGKRLLSCGIGCNEKTAVLPVGTWLRIETIAATRCGGGLMRETVMNVCPSRTRTCDFQLQATGARLEAAFGWSSGWISGFEKSH